MNEGSCSKPNGTSSPASALSVDKLISRFGGKAAPYASTEHFRQLYERAHLSIYRYIYSLHGGPAEEVEDLAAETFERAWKGRKRFRGDEDAATGWLITIARNLVVDAQRKRRQRTPPGAIDDLAHAAPAELVVEGHVLQDEQQQALLAALRTLPVQEREMVILRYMLDWPVKRIAAHYEMLENTASVKIRRALEHLRRHLPQILEEEK